ncbi:hypothetical protein AAVH_01234 [Aphelenchoides avenae]|nr:hypothetical protein AAVH_01234 [Aphelenchus avenae]
MERSGFTKELFGSTPLEKALRFDEWVTREVVMGISNTSVTVIVDFAVGIDVFSEDSYLSDVTFIVQERTLFANKGVGF